MTTHVLFTDEEALPTKTQPNLSPQNSKSNFQSFFISNKGTYEDIVGAACQDIISPQPNKIDPKALPNDILREINEIPNLSPITQHKDCEKIKKIAILNPKNSNSQEVYMLHDSGEIQVLNLATQTLEKNVEMSFLEKKDAGASPDSKSHNPILQMELSPDGKFLVLADKKNLTKCELSSHKIAVKKIVYKQPMGNKNQALIQSVLIHPNGDPILAINKTNRILLWEKERNELIELQADVTEKITSIAFYHEKKIITGFQSGKLSIWDETNKEIDKLGWYHKKSVTAILNISEEKLASGSEDQQIMIWKKNGASFKETVILNVGFPILSFIKILDCLIVGGPSELSAWNYQTFRKICCFDKGCSQALSLDQDSKLLGFCVDGCIGEWKIASNVESIFIKKINPPKKKGGQPQSNKEIKIDSKTNLMKFNFNLENFSSHFLKEKGAIILVRDNTIQTLDLKAKEIANFHDIHTKNITHFAVSLDEKYMVTRNYYSTKKANETKTILWEIDLAKNVKELKLVNENEIQFFTILEKFIVWVRSKKNNEKEEFCEISVTNLLSDKEELEEKNIKLNEICNIKLIQAFKASDKQKLAILQVFIPKESENKQIIEKKAGIFIYPINDLEKTDSFKQAQFFIPIDYESEVPYLIAFHPKANKLIGASRATTEKLIIWDLSNYEKSEKIEKKVMILDNKGKNLENKVKSFCFLSQNENLVFVNNMLINLQKTKIMNINLTRDESHFQIFQQSPDEYVLFSKIIVKIYKNIFCKSSLLEILSGRSSIMKVFTKDSTCETAFDQSIAKGEELIFPYEFNHLHLMALANQKIEISGITETLNCFLAEDRLGRNPFEIASILNNKERYRELLDSALQNFAAKEEETQIIKPDPKEKIVFFADSLKKKGRNINFLLQILSFFPTTKMDEVLKHAVVDCNDWIADLELPELEKPYYLIRNSSAPFSEEEKTKLKNDIEQELETSYFSRLKSKLGVEDRVQMRVKVESQCKMICLENIAEINPTIIGFFDRMDKLPANDIIFKNEVLNSLANYKWEAYCYRIYRNEFFIFLGIFAIYSFNFFFFFASQTEESNIVVSTVLESIVLCHMYFSTIREIRELKAKKWDYLLSLFNWIDIGVIVMSVSAIILDLCYEWGGLVTILWVKRVLAASMFFFWMKFISYIRGFQETSFMINLIIQVVKDIRYFLLFIVLFLLAFDTTTYFLQTSYNDSDSFTFFGVFNLFYRLLLGDYTQYDEIETEDDGFLWIVMFFFTLLSLIILLNMLISIINDSFAKLYQATTESRTHELMSLINDIDRSLFEISIDELRRKGKIGRYLFVIFNKEETEKRVDFETRNLLKKIQENMINPTDFKELKQKNIDLQSAVEKLNTQLKAVQDSVKSNALSEKAEKQIQTMLNLSLMPINEQLKVLAELERDIGNRQLKQEEKEEKEKKRLEMEAIKKIEEEKFKEEALKEEEEFMRIGEDIFKPEVEEELPPKKKSFDLMQSSVENYMNKKADNKSIGSNRSQTNFEVPQKKSEKNLFTPNILNPLEPIKNEEDKSASVKLLQESANQINKITPNPLNDEITNKPTPRSKKTVSIFCCSKGKNPNKEN